VGNQFHFHPEAYLELVRSEVPAYDRLQDVVAQATRGLGARSILDLGVGTGVTSQRVLAEHPSARLVGVDESSAMLDHARRALPAAEFRAARLEDPLPQGPFDLVVSVLAVHQLDGPQAVRAEASDHRLRIRRERWGAHLTGYNRLRVEVF
jgi:tRNA (cmo5U34)-methyltransferase